MWMQSAVLAIAGAFAIAIGLSAQQTGSPPDVDRLGPQVGARVPDFSLVDQNGRTETLQSILGPKGAILVFFRSADW